MSTLLESLGLVCSRKVPGRLILRTYDLARELAAAGVTVVGGFHSPMEQECLRLLLRGRAPVVLVLARRLRVEGLPAAWRTAHAEGRLRVESPFADGQRRTTRASAQQRNQYVAERTSALFVAYAEPGGATDALARATLARGHPVLTFDDPALQPLIDLGAQPIGPTWDWAGWLGSSGIVALGPLFQQQ